MVTSIWIPIVTKQERTLQAGLKAQGIPYQCNPNISGYFPDLLILNTNILVEVDGGVHKSKIAKEKDKLRTKHLNFSGYRVLRFSNKKIETELKQVIERIKLAILLSKSGRSGIVFKRGAVNPDQAKRSRAKAKELISRK